MQYSDCPTSVVAAVTIVVLSIVYYFLKNRNILPGPRGVPYFGLYPFLRHETCHMQLEEYGKKYGDLYSFTSFGTLIINLGSARAIREAHVAKSDCFEERFGKFNLLSYLLKNGVAFSNYEPWKMQRKFFVQSFRRYGLFVIRENTAGPLHESIASLLKDVWSKNGRPINLTELLNEKCTRAVRKAIFGDCLTDKESQEILRAWYNTLDTVFGAGLLVMGPIGKLLYKKLPKYRTTRVQHEVMLSTLMKAIKKIESDLNEDHPACVVEEFLAEKRKRRQKNDPAWKYFSDAALCDSIFQIFGDTVGTVAFLIATLLKVLVEHPEEQEKVYQELLDVVGSERLPTAEDRSNLRYTNAFMHEAMRTSDFVLLFPSLQCTRETTLRGYRVPKGSVTLLNTWQAHHDPNTYDEPVKFDPTRFLSEEGKPKAELPVLFGLGKRACIGEGFATLESFLFLTSIVLNFSISEPSAEESRFSSLSRDLVLVLKSRK